MSEKPSSTESRQNISACIAAVLMRTELVWGIGNRTPSKGKWDWLSRHVCGAQYRIRGRGVIERQGDERARSSS